MSKKILKELFIASDESSYDHRYPKDTHDEPSINNIENDDFRIDRNKYFFLTVEVIKSGQTICWLLPKIIIYLIFSIVFTGMCSLATFFGKEIMSLTNYIILNSVFHGSFILSYIFFYIKNFKLNRKYKNIRKNIKYRDRKIQENTMQNIADEIINKNIKLLRKLKLENLENK